MTIHNEVSRQFITNPSLIRLINNKQKMNKNTNFSKESTKLQKQEVEINEVRNRSLIKMKEIMQISSIFLKMNDDLIKKKKVPNDTPIK